MIAAMVLALAAGPALPDTACILGGNNGGRAVSMPANAPVRERSPLDSLTFDIGGAAVKICYGRPAARGRTMLGGQVPFGAIWRTGANEPTMIHASVSLVVAGVAVPAGTHTLYTVPGEREWEIVINRYAGQWGHERNYTDSLRAMELGRGRVRVGRTREPVERFTISAAAAPGGATLVLEWENSRVEIPVRQP